MIKGIILLLLTVVTIQNSYGQFAFNNIPFKLKNNPDNSFRIVQTRDGEISKIEEYDIDGNLIFQYIQGDIPPFFNWTEPHRFIYGFEFDETGNVVKRYTLNSNAGHNIYEYEFEDAGIVKTTYVRNYPDEGRRNTNSYVSISRIKTFEELKRSSEVVKMMSSEKLFLKVEYHNHAGKIIKINEYSHTYKDSLKTIINYDNNLNEQSRKLITSKNFRNGKKTSSYQFAKVKNEEEESEIEYSESSGKLNIRFYQYENGYLTKIVVYDTKFNDNLIVQLSKDYKKAAEMVYTYNEDGLLEKEEMTNYETGESETRTYNYNIEEL